jgi:BirA family biotin operon repressor/biotin-[acetyl-CoA-carboxylase] ligase
LDELLNMLIDCNYVSGEDISRRLGVTRAAIWKRVEALREQGIMIESAGKKGYHLIKPVDSLLPVFLKRGLTTKWAGQPQMIYSESMTSTNIVLKQAAESGAAHGTVALCEEQTAGRGRRGRNWVSQGSGPLGFAFIEARASSGQGAAYHVCGGYCHGRSGGKGNRDGYPDQVAQ